MVVSRRSPTSFTIQHQGDLLDTPDAPSHTPLVVGLIFDLKIPSKKYLVRPCLQVPAASGSQKIECKIVLEKLEDAVLPKEDRIIKNPRTQTEAGVKVSRQCHTKL